MPRLEPGTHCSPSLVSPLLGRPLGCPPPPRDLLAWLLRGPALSWRPGISSWPGVGLLCPCPELGCALALGSPAPLPRARRPAAGRRAARQRPVLCFTAAAARWCPQCEDADRAAAQKSSRRPPRPPGCLVSIGLLLRSRRCLPGSFFFPTCPLPAFRLVTPDSDPPGSMVLPHIRSLCLHTRPRASRQAGRPRRSPPSTAVLMTRCPSLKAHHEPGLKFEEKEKFKKAKKKTTKR